MLSKHFSLDEFTRSQTAVRFVIDNTPPPSVIRNLIATAGRLEGVRTALGDVPIFISSGYRSKALNEKAGGSPASAHCLGWAVDFTAPQFGPPREICARIFAEEIEFDQLIWEGTWVHIAFGLTSRWELLTAHFKAGEPTTYTVGV